MKILFIGLGGFFGSIARFLIARFFNNYFSSFPFGTLFVNVTGSFTLGFIIYSVTSGKNISPEVRDFLTIGFIGAYTTMSTFAYESFRLGELSEFAAMSANLILNIVLCFAAVFAGKELALLITK